MLQSQNIVLQTPDKHNERDIVQQYIRKKKKEKIMTQISETWICHTVYHNIIESHYRNKASHHQSWYVIRLLSELNATRYTSENMGTYHYVCYDVILGYPV
jgi:hypothetical protein